MSNYTELRKFQTLHNSLHYTLPCNTLPSCHSGHGTVVTTPTAVVPTHDTSASSTCILPSTCVTNTGAVISTDVLCNSNVKYVTKTVKTYLITPTKNGTIGFLVEKSLPFTIGQSISCSVVDSPDNYFNGTVFDYDANAGFLSIGNIDNVTGNFSTSVAYDVNLILFDPEVVKLKERMDRLYKFLFQVDLHLTPTYDPTVVQLSYFDKKMYNLLYYLFFYDMRAESTYVLTEAYLMIQINILYIWFFGQNLDLNLSFNPNASDHLYKHKNEVVVLNNLKAKIFELYWYLFSVDLEQFPQFDPNPIGST